MKGACSLISKQCYSHHFGHVLEAYDFSVVICSLVVLVLFSCSSIRVLALVWVEGYLLFSGTGEVRALLSGCNRMGISQSC